MKNKFLVPVAAIFVSIFLLLGKSPISKFTGNNYEILDMAFSSMFFMSVLVFPLLLSICSTDSPFFKSRPLRDACILMVL
jgi:hypothetical protein